MPDVTGNTNAAVADVTNVIQQSGNLDTSNLVGSTDPGVYGTDPDAIASQWRSSGIPSGAEANYDYVTVEAQFSTPASEKDWRVRISCDLIYGGNQLLKPLQETEGLIFPYLPNITLSHTANYSQMDIAHTNYPFFAYKNSQVDEITISGKFTVQTSIESYYWLATLHFLRSVTKMYFGQGENLGNPPPICTLNGYGDYVFNNVPCIVKTFNITLPDNVDYIECNAGQQGFISGTGPQMPGGASVTYVPVSSDISVVVQPIYSREEIKSFDLNAFAQGKMLISGDGKGFI